MSTMASRPSKCHCKIFLLLLVTVTSSIEQGAATNDPRRVGVCREPWSCDYQLVRTDHGRGSCQMMKIVGEQLEKECVMELQRQLFQPNDLPFKLTAFNSMLGIPDLSRLVISFPNLTSQNLTFRYHRFHYPKMNRCRKLTLQDLDLPRNETLFWDCFLYDRSMTGEPLNLTVLDDRGAGGLYTFTVPNGSRVDKCKTDLEDWEVFQFVHLEHIHRHKNVPVTLQLAPFANLTYNVSLLHCQDEFTCQHTILTEKHTVKGPERVDCHEEDPPHETVVFTLPVPGIYKVTTEISTHCPRCYYSSHSPKFRVMRSIIVEMVVLLIAGILFTILLFSLMSNYMHRTGKVVYNALKENPRKPTLLLVYHCCNENSYELVKLLATFLRETCFVHPLMVDNDGSKQNPNTWTSKQIDTADRVLFLVPEDLQGESITPIKKQWQYALHYVQGSPFNQINNAAAAILPSSVSVPHQIRYLKQFQLPHDLPSLLNWLHFGTLFDRWFLWPSLLEKANNENASVSLTDLKIALKHKTFNESSVFDIMNLKSCPENSTTGEQHLNQQRQEVNNCDPTLTPAPPSHLAPCVTVDQKLNSVTPASEFDSDIISVDNLWTGHQDYSADGYVSSDFEGSILGDDEYL